MIWLGIGFVLGGGGLAIGSFTQWDNPTAGLFGVLAVVLGFAIVKK
jgi:hypothetical protein